ncbi:MAG: SprT family zinc-dependent metalloprotease [Rhodothermales bacterium]
MTTEERPPVVAEAVLEVSGIEVEVVRKDIKNVHLSVYPPSGRVRIAVPVHVDDEAVRLAVIDRLDWIRRQQRELAEQPRQSRREMVTGESHYVWGHRYLLNVIRHQGPNIVRLRKPTTLEMFVRPEAGAERRRDVLAEWYREQLKERIPQLVTEWEPVLGVEVAEWGVKQMKTKWGSCTPDDRRIWLNLELAKKPPECLEYIVVHEMVHLLERHHNDRFRALMDRFMPKWRLHRDTLNAAPLSHEDWGY